MKDEDGIHPAPMGRRDEQIATGRQVLPTGRRHPKAKDEAKDDLGEEPDHPVQDRCARLRHATEPGEALDRPTASVGEGLGRNAARRWPAPCET